MQEQGIQYIAGMINDRASKRCAAQRILAAFAWPDGIRSWKAVPAQHATKPNCCLLRVLHCVTLVELCACPLRATRCLPDDTSCAS